MSRADYEHWNEERDMVWWQEEGRHYGNEDPPEPADPYDDDYWDNYEDPCDACGNWHDEGQEECW